MARLYFWSLSSWASLIQLRMSESIFGLLVGLFEQCGATGIRSGFEVRHLEDQIFQAAILVGQLALLLSQYGRRFDIRFGLGWRIRPESRLPGLRHARERPCSSKTPP